MFLANQPTLFGFVSKLTRPLWNALDQPTLFVDTAISETSLRYFTVYTRLVCTRGSTRFLVLFTGTVERFFPLAVFDFNECHTG